MAGPVRTQTGSHCVGVALRETEGPQEMDGYLIQHTPGVQIARGTKAEPNDHSAGLREQMGSSPAGGSQEDTKPVRDNIMLAGVHHQERTARGSRRRRTSQCEGCA